MARGQPWRVQKRNKWTPGMRLGSLVVTRASGLFSKALLLYPPMSLKGDAPGWRVDNHGKVHEELGPQCWKCRGSGERKTKNEAKKVVTIQCKVCTGVGRLAKKRKEIVNANAAGRVSKRTRKLPDGWVVPGPLSKGGIEPENGEELCHLLGYWRIFQRIGGHRWSSDDLVTAWCAGNAWRKAHGSESSPKHCLDLGCGIGSVLMMVAWQFTNASCLGVEAQKLSASMGRRSIEYNGCADRCKIEGGDIREFDSFTSVSPDGKYDLVTGTPPYFPVNYAEKTGGASTTYGGLPSCEQSAPARYEFRGGVEAYCEAAKPRLRNTSSRFCVCEGMLQSNHARVLKAAKDSGLHIIKQVSVHGREDRDALFAIYEMCLEHDEQPVFSEEKLVIRLIGGKRTKEYEELLKSMGIPP
mmetsp:Transcript_7219/g.11425  ORF Transcript_7219/g.11425 Transcript_7219/m.11425 type:complete len:412 (-) Transcript_7219:1256-2491(-)